MQALKQKLYDHCQQWIENRILLAQNTIRLAQESANEETKSSAGDKYETARAMAQQEIEKGAMQLAEASKLKRLMHEFSPTQQNKGIGLGSLAKVNQEWFYISISAGKVAIKDFECICLSPVSPLGMKMMGLMINDSFSFSKKDFVVHEVH